MYSGSNKYSGALAGDRAGSGLDAHDALETANAEESVVVPNINVEGSENEPEQVVLSASLDPQFGGLQWNPAASQESKFHEAISTSQMASMLKDKQRNVKYDAALRAAIAKFRERHGRAPVVLDVGCGTGLLSMMAARAGAKHVYACEMFESLAYIAKKTVEENFTTTTGEEVKNVYGEPIGPVDVFAKKSTDLTVAPKGSDAQEYDIPQRCDIMVSEILDSALLGEAVLPVIRHARQELLVEEPVLIPESAIVYGQILSSPLCRSFFDTRDTSLTVPSGGKTVNIPISRKDWVEAMGKTDQDSCPVSLLMPVHLDSIRNHIEPLSGEFECFRVDMRKGYVVDKSGEVLPDEGVVINTPVERAGNADVVAIWWDLTLLSESIGSIGGVDWQLGNDPLPHVYSTRPMFLNTPQFSSDCTKKQRKEELWGWQDHWVQCVHPLVDRVHPLQKGMRLSLHCVATDVRIRFMVVQETISANSEDMDLIEENQCVCGLHELNSIERIAMLNSKLYTDTLCATVSKNLENLGQTNGRCRAAIDISDGSVCALVMAAFQSCSNFSFGDVVTLEDKEMSQMVWTQVARALSYSLEDEDFLERFLVAENLVETTEMFEDEDAKTTEGAATGIVAISGEAYYYQMSNQQIWMALNYWYRSSAIARTIEYDCVTFPGRAILRAAAVDLSDLYHTHGFVGEVCGFSHRWFDNIQNDWCHKHYNYPLWQYEFTMSSPVVSLLEMNFGVQAFKEGNSYFETFQCIPLYPNREVNAVIVWVDLDMKMRKHQKGGGTNNANAQAIEEVLESYEAAELGANGITSGAPLAKLNRESSPSAPGASVLPWTKQTVVFLEKPVAAQEKEQLKLKCSIDHAQGKGVNIELL
eukprot:gb/GECG01010967.1/.p1 GENE.gb/GECG01010967.1/~~gb/GECG01010967.1/.p1  ORF type:complete len:869 (+),score=111.41 gb/GECG01010967.1/:1-2607(+)